MFTLKDSQMPELTVSILPELVIFGGPLPQSQFVAVSAAIFHAKVITGNILPRVHVQLSKTIICRPGKGLGARQNAGIQANGWKPSNVKTKISVQKMFQESIGKNYTVLQPLLVAKVECQATFFSQALITQLPSQ